jgi:formyl-CoA transferase
MSMEERMARADEVDSHIGDWTSSKPASEVVTELRGHGVPCGPILAAPDVTADPHVASRGALLPLRHPVAGETAEVVAPEVPFRLSKSETRLGTPAPHLGEHTNEVLGGLLGISNRELEDMRRRGVI